MFQISTTISGDSKLSDLIIEFPDVLSALEHFGIPLGIGDKTINETAGQYNIKPNVVLVIIKMYCKEIPTETLAKNEIYDFLNFLKTSHDHFKQIKIPVLKKLIENFSMEIPLEHGKVLIAFFDNYIKEVDEHFLYEDEIVFPYVDSVLNENNTKKYKITEFERNHTDIEQKLLDLKNILIKYIPSTIVSASRKQILNELINLEKDLGYHTLLEDNILVPFVKAIETKKG